LLIVLAGPVQAQQDEVTIVLERTVSVNQGMNAQFEEFIKALADASRRQNLKSYWLAAQSMSGEPIYRFNMAQDSWGDFTNALPQLAKTFGEQEAARLGRLAQESIAWTRTAFYEQHSSMSRPPVGMNGPPEALIYYAFTLNPGGAPQFLEMSTKVNEATAAIVPDSWYVSAMPSFGAPGPRTILLLEHLSDLDTPQMPPPRRLIEHFGQTEGARINALAGQAIASFDATLFRTRPDLNYQPAN
jgi:hypothetical protein